MTTAATHWINCAQECVEEPCCRSINFKKIVTTKSERNCEMLHNVVYNTSETLLENNASYDYIYFNNPRKVGSNDRRVRILIMKATFILNRKFSLIIKVQLVRYAVLNAAQLNDILENMTRVKRVLHWRSVRKKHAKIYFPTIIVARVQRENRG